MSYEQERAEFIVAMEQEGMHPDVARRILRHANTVQRLAALACSSEAADRDQVRCPSSKLPDTGACLCRDYGSYNDHIQGGVHGTVPRYAVQDSRAEQLIKALCAKAPGVKPVFNGDPRGACVKLVVPSGRTDDWGQTGVCVPTRRY